MITGKGVPSSLAIPVVTSATMVAGGGVAAEEIKGAATRPGLWQTVRAGQVAAREIR
jgi:hypothetical protein